MIDIVKTDAECSSCNGQFIREVPVCSISILNVPPDMEWAASAQVVNIRLCLRCLDNLNALAAIAKRDARVSDDTLLPKGQQ